MDPDTFTPSDVIHLFFLMEIDLDLSVGVPGGAAAPEDDEEAGEFQIRSSVTCLRGTAGFSVLCLCAEKVRVISPWVAWISGGICYKGGGWGFICVWGVYKCGGGL